MIDFLRLIYDMIFYRNELLFSSNELVDDELVHLFPRDCLSVLVYQFGDNVRHCLL